MERVEIEAADYERMYEAAVEMARSLIRETNAKGEKILRLRAEVRELREKVEELRYNPYHDPTNGRFTSGNGVDISDGSGIKDIGKARINGSNTIAEYTSLGNLNCDYLSGEFGELQTSEIVVTAERLEHIRERHISDLPLFEEYALSAVTKPDIVLKDSEHKGTVFMVKKLPETNLNVVVRLALSTDTQGLKSSVMTFYRIREKNLKKLKNKHKVLYKKE